ncbi:hypothetical protein [Aneurinibacillus thermoaerophilus]|uniref:hypothetical protein n=1 Tax=Aneurinibacillus thermoaerophilus TaxID=143495 RepID=UPI002E1C3710|nr:hypothetical protein [Aneurinibacillus thermoaerophilus]
MAKMIDCLNQLPDSMKMIDHAEIDRDKKVKTVAELKNLYAKDSGDYSLSETTTHYGKVTLKTIVSGRYRIFTESRYDERLEKKR